MKRSASIYPALLALLLIIVGACSSNVWDELPEDISSFVAQYWPGQGIAAYNETADGGSRVELSNSATLTFDSNNNWVTINGNGGRLPEVLVYDLLPPPVFNYLDELEQTNQVYKISRTTSTYIITLDDTYITFDTETGRITYPSAPAAG